MMVFIMLSDYTDVLDIACQRDAQEIQEVEKRGPVRSKKVVHDGITFASGLEKYMYIALKEK